MNIKRQPKGMHKFKYVESKDKSNQAVMLDGRILGFIRLDPQCNIQCLRSGEWIKGPRWVIHHKDGTHISHYPASRTATGRWLLAYEKSIA